MKNPTERAAESEETVLESDGRWALVRRILASDGFQRASQLRKILLYISRLAILHPEEVPRESEIACNILGRRSDFDPANDNIVRVQFSHLRRKLEHYFEAEGKGEPVVLTIPKGHYLPVFTPVPAVASLPETLEPLPGKPAGSPLQTEAPSSVPKPRFAPRWRKWKVAVAVVGVLILNFLAFAVILRRNRPARTPSVEGTTNPFVQFLARTGGDVTVVVPDTSLVMIENILNSDLSPADYVGKDFPAMQMAKVQDPVMKHLISDLARLRTTSVNEAMIAFDFVQTLDRVGVHATIRYARDLHVHDLSLGNTILLGGPGSDPWVSLLTNQNNFRRIDDKIGDRHYFENVNPAPGEQADYVNVYKNQNGPFIGYVDVALTQNPSQSGYVLSINGADLQANEAASRFLLHGRLPANISAVLSRREIPYFELFLRGKHMAGEADDSFELVAVRPR